MTARNLNASKTDAVVLNALGLVVGKEKGEKKYIIKWNDGTMRWAFSIRRSRPGFLGFLSIMTARSRILSIIVGIVCNLGGSRVLGISKVTFQVKDRGLLSRALKELGGDSWDLFFGTPGPMRNYVVAIRRKSKIISYLKAPACNDEYIAGRRSKTYFKTEIDAYKYIKKCSFKNISTPGFLDFNGALVTRPVVGNHMSKAGLGVVLCGLSNAFQSTAQKVTIEQYLKDKRIRSRIKTLRTKKPSATSFSLHSLHQILDRLNRQLQQFPHDASIDTGLAFIDFTPWNAATSNDSLIVIDLEFCEPAISAGYDLIHFYAQPWMMSRRPQQPTLFKEYLEGNVLELLKEGRFGDPSLAKYYVNFYLLQNVLRSVEIYVDQDKLHPQALTQISLWKSIDKVWLQ